MPSARKYSGQRSAAARKVAAAQLPAPCSICRRVVTAEMEWQADHITPRVIAEAQGWSASDIDSPSNIGPAHRSCNEGSGAKLGNASRAKAPAPRKIPKVDRPSLVFFDAAFPVPGVPPRNPSLTCGNDSQEPTE
jgi:hypothetical protein